MEHVAEEDLALLALGEPASEAVRAHVARCEECAAAVAELAAVVAVGRAVTPGDALVPPPPQVWTGIRDELGLAADLEPDGRSRAVTAPAVDEAPAESAPTAPVVDLAAARGRRGARLPWIAAAAAAGIVVGGVGATFLSGVRERDADSEVLAQARLEPLPGWDATGEAVVEVTPDGSRELVLSVEDAGSDGDFREVWLIDRDVTRLVSLGVLQGSEGRFTVPEGLDLSDFAVVDVSEEPFDGDPAHSGDSIVRGVLDA